jgi:uncharacterized protein (TIGR00369 family)
VDAKEVQTLLEELFPDSHEDVLVESVGNRSARVRLRVQPKHLRPGQTVSGPAIMALADTAMYVALLGELGPVTKAVTVSLGIHFLRRPRQVDLMAEAKLLKVGRRLAFGEISIAELEKPESPVAHATVSYALPAT